MRICPYKDEAYTSTVPDLQYLHIGQQVCDNGRELGGVFTVYSIQGLVAFRTTEGLVALQREEDAR